MPRVHAAARPLPKYIPAYTITKLEGNYTERKARMVPVEGSRPDKNGNVKHRLEFYEEVKPRGFLVTTPPCQAGYNRNGSVHIDTLEKLEELGLTDTEVPLVDDDGEVVGSVPLQIIKKGKTKELIDA